MRELQSGSGAVDDSDEELDIQYSDEDSAEGEAGANDDGDFFDGEEGLSDVDIG